jgi:hypothetical protein
MIFNEPIHSQQTSIKHRLGFLKHRSFPNDLNILSYFFQKLVNNSR